MAKIHQNHSGKKQPTNPERKALHEVRKYKVVYLDELRKKEQQQEIKDLLSNADSTI